MHGFVTILEIYTYIYIFCKYSVHILVVDLEKSIVVLNLSFFFCDNGFFWKGWMQWKYYLQMYPLNGTKYDVKTIVYIYTYISYISADKFVSVYV